MEQEESEEEIIASILTHQLLDTDHVHQVLGSWRQTGSHLLHQTLHLLHVDCGAACRAGRRLPHPDDHSAQRNAAASTQRQQLGRRREGQRGEKDRGRRRMQAGRARDHLDFTGRGRMLEGQLLPVEHASVLTVGRAVKGYPIRQQCVCSQGMQQQVQSSMHQSSWATVVLQL